jgi:Dyp-type peroxidase family
MTVTRVAPQDPREVPQASQPEPLQLDDIQGLAVRGYRMPVARFRLLTLTAAGAARQWLGALCARVTTAVNWEETPDICVNVAFTASGLRALGVTNEMLERFPDDFRQGMAARGPTYLGDTGPNAPEHWEPWFTSQAVHALVMVWGRSAQLVEELLDELSGPGAPGSDGIGLLADQPAAALPSGREHFGYRDGLSQPAIAGSGMPPMPGQAGPVAAGEFILGYPDQLGQVAGQALPAPLRRNSTFLVYRKLRQDVAGFRAFLRNRASHPGGEELLAARLLGRWRSGAPLVKAPNADDPVLADDPARVNDFDYERDDPRGLACPLGAHVRRARPRDTVPGRDRHLVIRRGLPYGPALPDTAPDDGVDRGIIGMMLNTSIERQFEFIQRVWLGDTRFDGLTNDVDPIVGPGGSFTIPGRWFPRILEGIPRFVTVRGGEYFFLPGIGALRWLASAGLADAHRYSTSLSPSRPVAPSLP